MVDTSKEAFEISVAGGVTPSELVGAMVKKDPLAVAMGL